MRKDMAKVVTERPRHKPYKAREHRNAASKAIDPEDGEHLPAKQGMRKKHRSQKSFSDLLGPLRKFFDRRVGRKWDQVHAEMKTVLKGNSTTIRHVFDHVKDFVAERVTFDSRGKPLFYQGAWGEPRKIRPGQLYIDPKGYLRRTPFKKIIYPDWRKNPEEEFLKVVQYCLKDVRLEIEGGEVWREFLDHFSGEWRHRMRATGRHAARDYFDLVESGDIERLKKILPKIDLEGAYFGRLKKAVMEGPTPPKTS